LIAIAYVRNIESRWRKSKEIELMLGTIARQRSGQATGRGGGARSLVQIWGSVSGPAIYRDASTMRLLIYTAVNVGSLSSGLSGAV
jgi:hypothetical protein